MYELPAKARALTAYKPLSGTYRIRLDANESFLDAPDWLRLEIAKAVSELPFNRYPDPYAVELCRRFAAFFGVDAQYMVAGNGSDELIGVIIGAFCEHGETVLTVSPDFSMYAFYAQMNGAKAAVYDKQENGLMLDAERLIAYAKQQDAKLIILSNPCNPTSLGTSRKDILRIVSELSDRLVVIDEAYMDFGEGSVLTEAADYDNLIVLKTCSKAFGMAAIRLGFAVSCNQLTDAIKAAKSPYNVSAMTQAAGCVLFEHKDYLMDCIGKIKDSRDRLFKALWELGQSKAQVKEVYRTTTNFVLLHVDDSEKTHQALKEKGIAVRHMGNLLRITAGSEQENAAVTAALDEILR